MMVFPEVIVEVTHARREVLACQVVNHVRLDFVTGGLSTPFWRNTRKEALGEVVKDGYQSRVLVQALDGFDGGLIGIGI